MSVETIDDLRVDQAAWCEGWRKSPLWLRLLGKGRTYYQDRGSYRLPWGELNLRYRGLALNLAAYETAHLNVGLVLFQVFVRLPFLDRVMRERRGGLESPQFGFSWTWERGSAIHFHWGHRTVLVEMPWNLEHIKTEYLDTSGEWRPRLGWKERDAEAPKWSRVLPYHYMLSDGEVQHVTATITRRRATHGRRWFGQGAVSQALRSLMPKKVFESIDVEFSEEVGSRRGSWKGGCVGCSYGMKPGETPEHTLRRMQEERRFR